MLANFKELQSNRIDHTIIGIENTITIIYEYDLKSINCVSQLFSFLYVLARCCSNTGCSHCHCYSSVGCCRRQFNRKTKTRTRTKANQKQHSHTFCIRSKQLALFLCARRTISSVCLEQQPIK